MPLDFDCFQTRISVHFICRRSPDCSVCRAVTEYGALKVATLMAPAKVCSSLSGIVRIPFLERLSLVVSLIPYGVPAWWDECCYYWTWPTVSVTLGKIELSNEWIQTPYRGNGWSPKFTDSRIRGALLGPRIESSRIILFELCPMRPGYCDSLLLQWRVQFRDWPLLLDDWLECEYPILSDVAVVLVLLQPISWLLLL